MEIVISILIVVVCVFMFIGTYLLNKRTKKPDGCEESNEHCASCSISSCSMHQKENVKEEVNND